MSSHYVHTDPNTHLAGLSDITGVIESSYGTVRIVEKYPNAIKVQVQTNASGGTFWRTPFMCLDAFVVVRDAATQKILGGSLISNADMFTDNCRGTALIRFKRPPINNTIVLELYKGGTSELFEWEATLEGVREGWADFIAQSLPIDLDQLRTTVEQGGVIQQKKKNQGGIELLGDTKDILKYATILVAAGAGFYFLAPLFPAIRDGIENIADSLQDLDKEKIKTGLKKQLESAAEKIDTQQ